MLILNERQQVFRFGFLQKGERCRLHLLGNLLDDALGIFLAQRFGQQRLGVFQAAFAEI